MAYLLRLMLVFALVLVLSFLERPVLGSSFDLLSQVSGREELVEWAGYGEEKLSTVVVAGRILCHAAHAHAQDKPSINTLIPVSGARVSVVCGRNRRRSRKVAKKWSSSSSSSSSSAQGSTDGSGMFAIDLPSHLHAIPNLERVCHVRVVNLPRSCPSNHNNINKAIRLSLRSIGQGRRTYTTNNIHLARSHLTPTIKTT